MQQSNYLSRSHTNTLIDSLIHTMVRFRYNDRNSIYIFSDNIQRTIRTGAIHHNKLYVIIILC